jgi:hypothetical protein
MTTFADVKAIIRAYLEQHRTATVEDVIAYVRDRDSDATPAQIRRAHTTVVRELGTAETAPALRALETGGLTATAKGFDTPASDTDPEWMPEDFVDTYRRVCDVFGHPMKAGTRRAYYEHLVKHQGCTLDELDVAVKVLALEHTTWPRIAEWYQAVLAVRRKRGQHRTSDGERSYSTDADGNALWLCERCRDDGWRPSCGCSVGALDGGFCHLHPRVVNGLTYRAAYVRCECARRA